MFRLIVIIALRAGNAILLHFMRAFSCLICLRTRKAQNQNQPQQQRQIPPVLHASIFPNPRLQSAQGLSRRCASLRPLTRHSVALTNPSALLSLLRYGENERKKMGGRTIATPRKDPCILSAVAPAIFENGAASIPSRGGNRNLGHRQHSRNSHTLPVAAYFFASAKRRMLVAFPWDYSPNLACPFACRFRALPANAVTRSASSDGTSAGTSSQASAPSRSLPVDERYSSRTLAFGACLRIRSKKRVFSLRDTVCPITATLNFVSWQALATADSPLAVTTSWPARCKMSSRVFKSESSMPVQRTLAIEAPQDP